MNYAKTGSMVTTGASQLDRVAVATLYDKWWKHRNQSAGETTKSLKCIN